jgi:hypothetical protein
MSADEQNRVFRADEVGNAAFQLPMQRLLAGNQSAGRHARAIFRHRVARRADDVRIARHAEIVVAAEVDVLLPGDSRAVVGDRLVHGEEGVGHTAAHR